MDITTHNLMQQVTKKKLGVKSSAWNHRIILVAEGSSLALCCHVDSIVALPVPLTYLQDVEGHAAANQGSYK